MSRYLDKSWLHLDKSRQSRQISTISMCLDNLDKNLDATKSQLKSLNFKNLNRDKIKINLDVMDNLDGFQKLVSTIEKSRLRSRFLDLVSTSMFRPKSLDRDREIRRDLKILAFLDSLSRSRSRSAWIFVFSRWDFSTNLDCILTNLDCDSTNLDNLDKNLDATKSRLKSLDFKNLNRDKIKVDLNVMDNLDRFQKLVSTRWTFLISIGLKRWDPQA